MKRLFCIISLISVIFTACFGFVSCGNRSYDEAVVKEEAARLIEKSMILNEIYWGEGIPYIPTSASVYCEANFLALSDLGFYTIDELKEKTRAVFSEGFCEYVFSTAFSSVNDGEEIQFYARYYQKYADIEKQEPECIMVYSQFKNLLKDKVEYLYDTLTVTHSKGDTVYVKITAKVTNEEGKEQYREKKVGLIEEESGWKLDTTTYLTYNSSEEEYKDLIENKNK